MAETVNFNSAVAGIHKGLESLQQNASQIASKSTLEGENQQSLPESLVGLKTSVLQVQASAQALKAVDEVLGTLLDIKA